MQWNDVRDVVLSASGIWHNLHGERWEKESRRRAPKNQRFPNAFDQMATRVIHDGR